MIIYEYLPDISRAIKQNNEALVTIGDKSYLYLPLSYLSIDELVYKFNGIWKHSPGKALAWIKRNATARKA